MPLNALKEPRKMLSVGMACLAVGLILQLAVHPASHLAGLITHALCGMLIGMSIVLNLKAVRLNASHRRPSG
jgi:hypothetical protein